MIFKGRPHSTSIVPSNAALKSNWHKFKLNKIGVKSLKGNWYALLYYFNEMILNGVEISTQHHYLVFNQIAFVNSQRTPTKSKGYLRQNNPSNTRISKIELNHLTTKSESKIYIISKLLQCLLFSHVFKWILCTICFMPKI